MSYINEAEEAGMAMRRQFGSGAGAKKLNGTAVACLPLGRIKMSINLLQFW